MLKEFIADYESLVGHDNNTTTLPDLAPFAESYRALPRAAKYPPKSFLSVIRRSHDENTISDYLSYLLDFTYSDESLSLIAYLWQAATGDILPLTPTDIISFRIERERSLGSNGRIDILLLINHHFLLAIEAKVYAPEGEGQTKSYAAALDEEFPSYAKAYVFLTLFPTIPSSKSFTNVLFTNLVQQIEGISYAEPINNQLATNFTYHMKEYLMGNKTLALTDRALLYLKHKAAIDDVVSTFTREAEQIFEAAMEYPVRILGQLTNEVWVARTRANRGYQQFLKESWEKTDGIWVHFEYDISAESLITSGEIECMLHVEGANAGKFFDLFEKALPKYEKEYSTKKLSHRPRNNRAAIACRRYPMEIDYDKFDMSVFERFFSQTLEDFAFLIPAVDSIYSKL